MVDPNVKRFGCNFIRTKITEFKEDENYLVRTNVCNNDPISIKQCLSEVLEKLMVFADKHCSKSYLEDHNKVVVFHRNVGDKKEMFVTLQSRHHQIGTPINWLD